MKFNERLKNTRKEHGLTQMELAEKAGIAVNSVRLYESGKVVPKLDTIAKIARAMGLYAGDLIDAGQWGQVLPWDSEKLTKQLARRKELLDSIEVNFDFLNAEGQEEAAKRVQELTEIQKYRFKIAPADGENQTDPDK